MGKKSGVMKSCCLRLKCAKIHLQASTIGRRSNPGSTAVLGEDRVTVSGRSQYGILGGHWDVTFCNPGVTPVMDI
jgi:hypothetical protein